MSNIDLKTGLGIGVALTGLDAWVVNMAVGGVKSEVGGVKSEVSFLQFTASYRP